MTARYRKRVEAREVAAEIAEALTATPAAGPAFRPDQLLSARHDTPDPTGALTDWEVIG